MILDWTKLNCYSGTCWPPVKLFYFNFAFRFKYLFKVLFAELLSEWDVTDHNFTITFTIAIQWGKKWDLTSIIVKRTKVEIYFESFLNLQFYWKLQNSYTINWTIFRMDHDQVGHPIIVQSCSRNGERTTMAHGGKVNILVHDSG